MIFFLKKEKKYFAAWHCLLQSVYSLLCFQEEENVKLSKSVYFIRILLLFMTKILVTNNLMKYLFWLIIQGNIVHHDMAALEVTLHRLSGSRQMNMDAYVFPSSPCSVQNYVHGNALLTFRAGFSSSITSPRGISR